MTDNFTFLHFTKKLITDVYALLKVVSESSKTEHVLQFITVLSSTKTKTKLKGPHWQRDWLWSALPGSAGVAV